MFYVILLVLSFNIWIIFLESKLREFLYLNMMIYY